MRKYFLSLVAMAAMILFSGCNKNEDFYISENGDMVTFNIATPEMGTRAFSDGTTATNLIVAVYQGGQYREALTQNVTINGSAQVSLPLVTGVTYDIVFWAYATGAPYTFNPENGIVSVNYNGVTANNENLDAFYANKLGYTVQGPKTETIKLTRPFAQLNVATLELDYESATNSGINITQTAIEVEGVYTSFNLRNAEGAIDANTATTIILGLNNTPKAQSEVLSGYETYSWLSMNYLLVNEKTTVRAKMATNNGNVVREWFNIPVQRNYRTNILGNILTTTTDFNVVIEEEWNNPDFVEEYVAPGVRRDDNDNYEITSVEGLESMIEGVNNGEWADEDYVLSSDIDLSTLTKSAAIVSNWVPMGTEDKPFTGTFDGNGHTIKNLTIVETEAKEGKAFIGFFGYAKDATIKDVTFENVYLNIACLDIDHSQGHIGAVAGSLEGTSTIENVTVKGDIKVESTVSANGASRVAVVAGGNSGGDVTMKNVHVIANEGSYLKANNNVGALAGQLQVKSVFENCSSNIDVTGTKFFAGGIIGLAAGDQTFINCHTTGDVTITAGREGRNHDQYRVGGIAGGWADGAKNVCTLTDCSYEGSISGTNSDGSVANPLDYAGYVGRGYTLNGCQGSKVVIDGVEYVQAFNTAAEAGIYYINGVWTINSATELKMLADKVNGGTNYFEGKTIKLGDDIDLNNQEWIPIGSATKDHGFRGNFDGGGTTIKNLKIEDIKLDSDGYAYAGLFGVTEGTADKHNCIKNLNIENVNISTEGHIVSAAIAYPYYTTVENITVKGNISIKGGDYTAGVLAYTRRCVNVSNIAIDGNTDSSIEGGITVGGVISDIQMNGGLTAYYTNFSAKDLTIEASHNVGGISGIISNQTLDGANVENVTIHCTDARRGIVSGSLGGTSKLNNVTYDNVMGATSIIGASYDNGPIFEEDGVWKKLDIGTIVNINGIKGIIFSVEDDNIKAVSIEQGGEMTWDESITWAKQLGDGWKLASLDELKAIYNVRVDLNKALVKENAENILFEEDNKEEDGTYAAYWSSTLVESSTSTTPKAYYMFFDATGRETTSFTMFPVEYSRAVYVF